MDRMGERVDLCLFCIDAASNFGHQRQNESGHSSRSDSFLFVRTKALTLKAASEVSPPSGRTSREVNRYKDD